jgi:hydroxyacylglutathione hydrolase
MTERIEKIIKQVEAGSAQLLDVREPDEWSEGHLVLAQLTPLSGLREGVYSDGLKKDIPTFIHCRSGVRVQTAAPLLEQFGFEKVIPLSEGFEELVREGVKQA